MLRTASSRLVTRTISLRSTAPLLRSSAAIMTATPRTFTTSTATFSAPPSAAPLFRLTQPTAAEEEADYQSQIASIQSWFDSPRFAQTKRSYSAALVASKRGTQPISPLHSSNISAKKLWAALTKASEEGRPLNTMGAIDPIQMTQMAPHSEVLYVSGWASSSVLTTGNNEVGPDLGMCFLSLF